MKQLLANFLLKQGFIEIPSSLPEFSFCFHLETQYVNVVHLIDYRKDLYISTDQYEQIKAKIQEFFQEKNLKEIHILSLIFSDDINKAQILKDQDRFCWIMDTKENKLVITPSSVEDFYGMKRRFEEFLKEPEEAGRLPEAEQPDGQDANGQPEAGNQGYSGNSYNTSTNTLSQYNPGSYTMSKNMLPFVNGTLVGLNVLIFLVCTMTGDLLYNMGMLTGPDTLASGQYYRLVTCMFLHAGADHLVNNMLILIFLGNLMERTVGHIRYLILYMVAGIGGSLFSIGYQSYIGSTNASVGASGAVFGLFGALLLYAMVTHGRIANLSLGRVAFVIAFSLYLGFTATNVDNAAHVGGVIAGFVTAVVLYLIQRIWKRSSTAEDR